MKLCFPIALLVLATGGISTPAFAGPSCDVRPNHPNCEPSGGGSGPVYWVNFLDDIIITGERKDPDDKDTFISGIYTTPGTLDGDESGLNANPNGPNEVKFVLYDFLAAALKTDEVVTCFPPNFPLSGSIQLQDNHVSSGDLSRVGYIWVHAFDASGKDMQYAIDLFDDNGWWVEPLLPSVSETSTRSVTHWQLRRTKKKNVNECVSDGFIEVPSDTPFTITVQKVDKNPWY